MSDLPQWYDPAQLRLERIEAVFVRARPDYPGEFVAICNAIAMQLDSCNPDLATIHHLLDALRTLAEARSVDTKRARLEKEISNFLAQLNA